MPAELTPASVRAMLDDREAPRPLEATRDDDDDVWCIYDHKARRIALCEPECGWYARLFAAAPDLARAYLAAMENERRAVVAYLRGMADRYDREGTAATLATAARDIEAGAHTTTEGAPDADPR